MANGPINEQLSYLQQSIEALESRNAFQDDVIEQLNNELAIHQQEISELKQQLKLIADRMKNQSKTQLMRPEDEPPPPHY